MRKALVVGVNFYRNIPCLKGCIHDAYSVESVLDKHSDGTQNFDVELRIAYNKDTFLTKNELKDMIRKLFEGDSEVALLYFAGHGYVESNGGYILTSDCDRGDDGINLADILRYANKSSAINKVIILDSCHSGDAGVSHDFDGNTSILSEGVTILTASTSDQYSAEVDGKGLFTGLFTDAMEGSAANLLGDITPSSVYAHIDQSLGPWEQRPVFKTNVKNFISLRRTVPPIELSDLRALTELFVNLSDEFQLDPSYEPDSEAPNPENNRKFRILQNCNRVNLVVPVTEKDMYYAAMNSKTCKLTSLGMHYWNLVTKNRI